MIVIEDCDNEMFIATSIHKVLLTKKWDIKNCKIKVRKNLTQSLKLSWIVFNWYLTNETLNKHFLFGTWLVIVSVTYGSRYFGTGFTKFEAQVSFFIFSECCREQSYCKVKLDRRSLKFSFIKIYLLSRCLWPLTSFQDVFKRYTQYFSLRSRSWSKRMLFVKWSINSSNFKH